MRGGKREGAGRPPKPVEERRIQIAVYVLPETLNYLRTHKIKGGAVLDEYVEIAKDEFTGII